MDKDVVKKYLSIIAYSILAIALAIIIMNYGVIAGAFKVFFNLILPFVYAFAFAYILNPIVKFFDFKMFSKSKRLNRNPKIKRALSIATAYLITLVLLVVFFWIVIPQVSTSVYTIVSRVSTYAGSLEEWVKDIAVKYPELAITPQISQKILEYSETLFNSLSDILGSTIPFLLNATTKFTSGILNIIVGIIVSIYMLTGKERFFAQTKKVLYAFFKQNTVNRVISLMHDTNNYFSKFINGKLLDSLIIGILCFIGMTIFNMPYALFISIIVAITNVIPYFGPFIGAIPSFLIIFTVDIATSFWFLLFILILQQFDGNILGPKILGNSTGLSAFWVIFSIIIFGGMFGVVGMFIGVPLFAVIYSVIKALVTTRLQNIGMPTDTSDYASERHKIP